MPQLALIAQPENYEIMFRREKTKFLADLILLLFDHIITELYDFSALCTDEMLMMLLSERILKMDLTCAYIDLGYKSVFDKQIKCSIYSSS